MAVSNIKPAIRKLKAYTLKRHDCAIKLNQNESPMDLPDAFKARVLKRVARKPWNRYPDFHPLDVLEKIGQRHNLPAESVLIGNGSNELLQAIFLATVGIDQVVSLPSPTFSLYKMMVEANGGQTDQVYMRPDLSYDFDAYQRRAAFNNRHLVLCNPNNPTGSWIEPEQIAALCAQTEHLVIVDEAYIEFANHSGDACAALIANHSNLIVLRTFSKAVGLAGIRFGYALGSPEVMTEISKIKLPYNVGHFTLEAVREALDSPDWVTPLALEIIHERTRVSDALTSMGVEVFPSRSNFILFRHNKAGHLWSALSKRGILIRDVSHYPRLSNCLRVTLGSTSENDAFIKEMRAIIETLP